MMEKVEPPLLLPDQVQRYLPQADFIFSSFHGLEGLVSSNECYSFLPLIHIFLLLEPDEYFYLNFKTVLV